MNSKDRTKHFFTLWSLKESYIKWKGTGLRTLLESFRFIYNQEKQLIFSSDYQDSCFFQTIQLDPQHFAHQENLVKIHLSKF
ncbi:4'-phosphopantetheinyl transferase superfamily protein [Bacillus atrophaeus]|uniref:4'-phosphopantetheinyl transferase superfamily protein n=1 Tax=Bacillus atrophaeus TaxID=1452 RepID=UPI0039909162